MDIDFIKELLLLACKYDIHDELWWNDHLEFFVICNDVFAWGCADCERITKESLPILDQALQNDEYTGSLLYCARMRKMRPQGAMYKHIDKDKWPLFDACGPIRETGIGNPQKQPTEK